MTEVRLGSSNGIANKPCGDRAFCAACRDHSVRQFVQRSSFAGRCSCTLMFGLQKTTRTNLGMFESHSDPKQREVRTENMSVHPDIRGATQRAARAARSHRGFLVAFFVQGGGARCGGGAGCEGAFCRAEAVNRESVVRSADSARVALELSESC